MMLAPCSRAAVVQGSLGCWQSILNFPLSSEHLGYFCKNPVLGQEAGKGLLLQPGLFLSRECLTQKSLLFLSKKTLRH